MAKQFLADDSDNAYENLVDQLLTSPQYGERMAVYWLDLVRYADTVGYHGDQTQNISPYRDWVINAFNTNQPFDQFTRDQIAGDLVPSPSAEQIIATGYNRLLQTTHEGGLQQKEYRAIYAADRVRNVSAVWMGATVGYAQCHDHKFDPYTAHDFYSLSAFFADVDDEKHFTAGSNSNPTARDPELLDRLAHAFVESDWNTRAMMKLIVTSRTYQQSSVVRPVLMSVDPNNRLYARQSAYRLPAEMVRDNALAIAGLLVQHVGGASVKPYQPAGYYRHLNFPERTYEQDNDDRQWRRGVYVHWQRQFLHPMLKAFDAPGREECTAQRAQSNTPMAALVLLNDPTFVEAARAFATRTYDLGTQCASTVIERKSRIVRHATRRCDGVSKRRPDEAAGRSRCV